MLLFHFIFIRLLSMRLHSLVYINRTRWPHAEDVCKHSSSFVSSWIRVWSSFPIFVFILMLCPLIWNVWCWHLLGEYRWIKSSIWISTCGENAIYCCIYAACDVFAIYIETQILHYSTKTHFLLFGPPVIRFFSIHAY